ncbi:MAG: PilZ domain-containing protein [Nitrospira sp.]|jgi:glycine cleavage system aminomethyltransferase T|nr:MAG: PilZ domain-containing protein [Nitrospira sp. CG24D]TKB87523.1 MAG: PilZ domain-containing protein [Nitrospira sp.]
MKRGESKQSVAAAVASERRKFVRATLVGSALIAPKSGGRASTAVLDNVNKIGAGLHTKDRFPVNERVTVSLAFLDSDGADQQEKLEGTVAWVKDWEKGFLTGVVWDDLVTREKNRWLFYYLEETIRSSV